MTLALNRCLHVLILQNNKFYLLTEILIRHFFYCFISLLTYTVGILDKSFNFVFLTIPAIGFEII